MQGMQCQNMTGKQCIQREHSFGAYIGRSQHCECVHIYVAYCVAILVCISSYYLIYGRNVHMIHSCGSLRVYDYIRIESALAVNTQNALGNMSETQ